MRLVGSGVFEMGLLEPNNRVLTNPDIFQYLGKNYEQIILYMSGVSFGSAQQHKRGGRVFLGCLPQWKAKASRETQA